MHDYGSHAQTLLLKYRPQNIEAMLSIALDVPIGKRVTDHCSMLVQESICFFQELVSS